jgi:hypothetical protein
MIGRAMNPKYTVYEDGEISVGLFAEDAKADQKHLLHLGVRWLRPKAYKGKDGKPVETTNIMGGETQWFLLPHSFGVAVGRTLIEQKVANGLEGYFNEQAFRRMVSWAVEMGELSDGMCY